MNSSLLYIPLSEFFFFFFFFFFPCQKVLIVFLISPRNKHHAPTFFGLVFHGIILSFKIEMSGRAGRCWAGYWCFPRFTIWLIFFFFKVICYLYSSVEKPIHNDFRHFFFFFWFHGEIRKTILQKGLKGLSRKLFHFSTKK